MRWSLGPLTHPYLFRRLDCPGVRELAVGARTGFALELSQPLRSSSRLLAEWLPAAADIHLGCGRGLWIKGIGGKTRLRTPGRRSRRCCSARSSVRAPVLSAPPATTALLPDTAEDHRHDDRQWDQVEDEFVPVKGAGVGEQPDRLDTAHPLAWESRKRPRLVKPTISASIQYCDREARCGSSYTVRARS